MHVRSHDELHQLADFGVTTALDFAAWPVSLVESLRVNSGGADFRSAGTPATSLGSAQSRLPGCPSEAMVSGPTDAERFVVGRLREGSDYIKLFVDEPGPDQATLDALVMAAHSHGTLTIAHARSTEAVDMALRAHVDIITHVPFDEPLGETLVSRALDQGCSVIPTLVMMRALSHAHSSTTEVGDGPSGRGWDFDAALASVATLHRAGVPLVAGTDANSLPFLSFSPKFGESLHDELVLLVEAGLSPADALRAATVIPARLFGLDDRGVIEVGRRADLVLVEGDPLADISATRRIRAVWCAGDRRDLSGTAGGQPRC